MLRILTLTLALAAAPAWAAGPSVSVSGAQVVQTNRLGGLGSQPCGATGRATIHITFADPEGIAFASVNLGSVRVRPEVTPLIETSIWVPSYARPDRSYRWRYENQDERNLATSHTIPVSIELVPGSGPIPAEIMAKDGSGALTIRTFRLVPAACR